jgi:hypothetical protein
MGSTRIVLFLSILWAAAACATARRPGTGVDGGGPGTDIDANMGGPCGTVMCGANSSCDTSSGTPTCKCDQGFAMMGTVCADVDECTAGTAVCDPNAMCVNQIGSYTCMCKSGFMGDGHTCTDMDECTTGMAACDPNATCANTPGAYTCTCNPGWMGPGTVCTDVDECTTGMATCDPNATCANTPGSYQCNCNPGWTASGSACVDVNECTSGTAGCDIHALCTNTPGSFTCMCNVGWVGDGFTCMPGPSCTTVEDFESGAWPGSWSLSTAGGGGGSVATTSAHDGAWGLADSGSSWWVKSSTLVGTAGGRLTAWVRGTGGRAYIGFDATLSGGKSFVIGPNTGTILFQDNAGWGYTEFTMSPISLTAGTWYKAEIVFNGGGSVTGNLYASDGVTLVSTVGYTYPSIGVNGVSLRSFGGMDIDSIVWCP